MVKVIHDFFFHTLSQHLSCKKILTLGKDEEDVVSFHPTSGFFFWFLKVGWKRSGAAATVESFFAAPDITLGGLVNSLLAATV